MPPATPPPIHLASLFLGPKAENAEALERLLLEALRDHVFWRRNFHPEDGFEISELTKRTPEYERAMSVLSQELLGLLGELKGGVPFFSPRYIGHMSSDLTLASLVGYFATMLYNPNNVALEGSPVTTRLELEVAGQLATMVGYPADTWGHLTSGGTIANFEAFWVARNVKYLPVAIAGAADELGLGDLPVELGKGRARLGDLDLWALLNVAPGAALDLADRLLAAAGEGAGERERAAEALSKHSLSRVGHQEYGRRLALEFEDPLPPAVVLCPSTAHYSWGKICRALGIGSDQLRHVPVDAHFRIDLDALWTTLEGLARSRTPVLAVVAVAGTTEEGAIDRVDRLVELRRRAALDLGLGFPLHADAAWGGYAAAILRNPDGSLRTFEEVKGDHAPQPWPTPEVYHGLAGLADTDSITIDPHKFGFVPYPAGAVLFRDRRVRTLVATDAPYVFQEESPATVTAIGPYILEGSKPGAAAASVWLSHRVLPLDATAHGRLIGATVKGALRLHARLSGGDFSPFRVVTLPAPDLNIVCFGIAHPNLTDLATANRFVTRLHGRMSTAAGRPSRELDYVVTRTVLRSEEYGETPVPFVEALGFSREEYEREGGVAVLRCTVMDPFSGEPHGKTDYVEGFAVTLAEELALALGELG